MGKRAIASTPYSSWSEVNSRGMSSTALAPMDSVPAVARQAGPGTGHWASDNRVVTALIDEALQSVGSDVVHPSYLSIPMREVVRATAAETLRLLPAIPETTNAATITKSDYRSLCQEAIRLANGGEGLFANFVETMIETNSLGFENRLGLSLEEIGQSGQQTGQPAPKTKKGGRNAPKGGTEDQLQGFVSIFNTFCRMVNANPQNGKSLIGRERGMDAIQRQFVWNYWVTGMFPMVYRWGSVQIPDLNYRPFQVPIEMTILDPMRVDLNGDKSDFLTRGLAWYDYPDRDAKEALIKEIGLYGGPEKHPWFGMYPKKVDKGDPAQQNQFTAAEALEQLRSKNRLPLPPDNFKLIRRTFSDRELYPIPFAARIYSPVNDKRLLRQMDRSLIRKVIMMILKISVKSPNPSRPIQQGDLAVTVNTIQSQLQSDPEYLQMLSVPDGTDVSWVTPEADAILNQDRYRTVDFEILCSMLGIVVSQLLNTSGTADLTMVGKTLWAKNQLCLQVFRRFVEEIYDEIIQKSNIRAIKPSDVNMVFKQISIFEPEQFRTFVGNLVMRGLLPAKAAIDLMGEDYDTMIRWMIKEQELRGQFGILSTLPTNVQQSTTDGQQGPESQDPPGGRPPGAPNTQPRRKARQNPDAEPEQPS